MDERKIVKVVTSAATLGGITAGIGILSRKAFKERLTNDPSLSLSNFAKFTAALASAITLKEYLVNQKNHP